MGVLLSLRGVLPGMLQGLPGEGAEVAVFADLGVVDVPLATDPPQERLRLSLVGVAAKAEAGLHLATWPWVFGKPFRLPKLSA